MNTKKIVDDICAEYESLISIEADLAVIQREAYVSCANSMHDPRKLFNSDPRVEELNNRYAECQSKIMRLKEYL